MLKKILVGSLMVFCFHFSHGQRFKAGLIGGLSTTQVAGDQLSGFNKAGVIAGGFVSNPVSDKSSLQMEILFIQKGSRKPVQPDKDNEYYVMRLAYFEVPVLFKYQVSSKINVELGLSIGALMFSEEEDQLGLQRHKPAFNKTDFSGIMGFTYPLSDHLFFNLRLSNSIIPIRDFASGYSFAFFNRGQYNTVVAFTLHYQF